MVRISKGGREEGIEYWESSIDITRIGSCYHTYLVGRVDDYDMLGCATISTISQLKMFSWPRELLNQGRL